MLKGLEKLERRRSRGLLWKWRRTGTSHEVTTASRDARRKIEDDKQNVRPKPLTWINNATGMT